MDPASQTPTPAEGLQFDRAEFAPGATLACTICKTPLQGEYFQVNGKNICPACRTKLEENFTGGSKVARFGKAAAAGVVAGFAGFVIYWAVRTFFHMELALIAIAVGWMVGRAIHWGANGRGGTFYQLMAVVITYVAICSSYVPMILSDESKLPFLIKLPLAMIFALAVPWLEGPSNIIGWVIIAIGLYQAWVMNRKPQIQITGPYLAPIKAPEPTA